MPNVTVRKYYPPKQAMVHGVQRPRKLFLALETQLAKQCGQTPRDFALYVYTDHADNDKSRVAYFYGNTAIIAIPVDIVE